MRMKRITALALAGCLTASMLTACGNAISTSGAASGSASAAHTVTTAVPAVAGLSHLHTWVLYVKYVFGGDRKVCRLCRCRPAQYDRRCAGHRHYDQMGQPDAAAFPGGQQRALGVPGIRNAGVSEL